MSSVVAAEAPAELAVSLSVRGDTDHPAILPPPYHFDILLVNRGNNEQRVWQTSNSWGYYTFSLRITDADGKIRRVKRCDTVFTRNGPGYAVLLPGQAYTVKVRLGDCDKWNDFSIQSGEEQTLLVQALYDVAVSADSTRLHVWTGHLESESIAVRLVH
jgi:hypothetical protein